MRITGIVGQRPDTLLMLLREGGRNRRREGGGRKGRRERGGRKGRREEGKEGGREGGRKGGREGGKEGGGGRERKSTSH